MLQMTFDQSEIDHAIRDRVKHLGMDIKDSNISVEYKMGRGANKQLTADITITPKQRVFDEETPVVHTSGSHQKSMSSDTDEAARPAGKLFTNHDPSDIDD